MNYHGTRHGTSSIPSFLYHRKANIIMVIFRLHKSTDSHHDRYGAECSDWMEMLFFYFCICFGET